MTDDQLIARIADAALLRGDFTLRSGRQSRYYLDKYRFATQPDILAALGQKFAEVIARQDPPVDRLAGPELGGVPLVTAAALATGLPMVLIRNAKKDYGTAQQFEGVLHAGERLLITEDIATTGGQSIEAARLLRDELDIDVAGIVVVIDREEGARENVESAGFAFEALFTKTQLGIEE
jgi:orotate phosphoribosyltransferase